GLRLDNDDRAVAAVRRFLELRYPAFQDRLRLALKLHVDARGHPEAILVKRVATEDGLELRDDLREHEVRSGQRDAVVPHGQRFFLGRVDLRVRKGNGAAVADADRALLPD